MERISQDHFAHFISKQSTKYEINLRNISSGFLDENENHIACDE